MKRQQALHPIPEGDACRSTRRDDVNVGICWHALLDRVEDGPKLDATMPLLAAADDRAGLDVQGRKQVGRATPPIVVRMALDLPRAHRQDRCRRS
jgi:hypothetical protein